jgi:hypothetical protein
MGITIAHQGFILKNQKLVEVLIVSENYPVLSKFMNSIS